MWVTFIVNVSVSERRNIQLYGLWDHSTAKNIYLCAFWGYWEQKYNRNYSVNWFGHIFGVNMTLSCSTRLSCLYDVFKQISPTITSVISFPMSVLLSTPLPPSYPSPPPSSPRFPGSMHLSLRLCNLYGYKLKQKTCFGPKMPIQPCWPRANSTWGKMALYQKSFHPSLGIILVFRVLRSISALETRLFWPIPVPRSYDLLVSGWKNRGALGREWYFGPNLGELN